MRIDSSRSAAKNRWPWSAVTTAVLDARRGELPDGAREVVDDRVHHLARLEA